MNEQEQLARYWKLLADWFWRESGKSNAICDSCGAPMSSNSGYYSPFIFRNELFCEGCVDKRSMLTLANIDSEYDAHCKQEFAQAMQISASSRLVESRGSGPMRTEDAFHAIEGLSVEQVIPSNDEMQAMYSAFQESHGTARNKKWWQFWKD